MSIVALTQPALALGVPPHKLAGTFDGDVAALRLERDLAADAARAELRANATYAQAEAAQRELAIIESKVVELRRIATSGHAAGMMAGQVRASCDRYRAAHPRLWDDAHCDNPAAAERALQLPADDTPAPVAAARTHDAAEWIVDTTED